MYSVCMKCVFFLYVCTSSWSTGFQADVGATGWNQLKVYEWIITTIIIINII